MKMKTKKIGIIVSFALLLSMSFAPGVYAYQGTSGSAVVAVTSGGIGSGDGTQIEIEGTIAPSVMSVTMPSNIMFDMTKSTGNSNKVLSPDIEITNSSYEQVAVYANNTWVDLSNLPGAVYATGVSGSAMYISSGAISVLDNEVAVGISSVPVSEGAIGVPGLDSAMWLMEGTVSGPLAYIDGNSSTVVHVVGTLGNGIAEGGSFRVTPTLIAVAR